MGDRVGGFTRLIAASSGPFVSVGSAYASGDCIGGLMALVGAARGATAQHRGSGLINTVLIGDKASQEANLDLIIFDSLPTTTAFIDNSTLAILDADLPAIVGVAQVTTYMTQGDNSFGQAVNLGLPFDAGASHDLYCALVCRGTPTFVASGDLMVRVGIIQD